MAAAESAAAVVPGRLPTGRAPQSRGSGWYSAARAAIKS
jgi:hypothetical protein